MSEPQAPSETTPEARRSTPRPLAWVDGRVLPAAEATVPLLDDGFLRGDAVFDTMLVRRGRTHARDAHLARLRRSGRVMGIRVPALGRAVGDLLAAWGERDGALKLIVTRGGTVRGLIYAPRYPNTIALAVIEAPWRTAISGAKTLSYAANQWALREAETRHADDALLVDAGLVHELPTGALCVVRDGAVASPDPARVPILDSVTVSELATVHSIERRDVRVEELDEADELFVVSATRPVLAVHALVGADQGSGPERELAAPGTVTSELAARFAAHIDAALDPLP